MRRAGRGTLRLLERPARCSRFCLTNDKCRFAAWQFFAVMPKWQATDADGLSMRDIQAHLDRPNGLRVPSALVNRDRFAILDKVRIGGLGLRDRSISLAYSTLRGPRPATLTAGWMRQGIRHRPEHCRGWETYFNLLGPEGVAPFPRPRCGKKSRHLRHEGY